MKHNIRFLFSVFRGRKPFAAAVCAVMILNALAECISVSLIFPLAQAVTGGKNTRFYDTVPFLKNFSKTGESILPLLCGIFIAALLLKAAIGMLNTYLSRKFALTLRYEWMRNIFNRYVNENISFLLSKRHGELLNSLINETRRASICIIQGAKYLTKLIVTVSLAIMLIALNSGITLLIFVFALSAITIIYSMKKYAAETGRKRSSQISKISEIASETISGIRQIKILGIEERATGSFNSER
jgi:ABC-type multidrug transport system fused ATPase/permease subunit